MSKTSFRPFRTDDNGLADLPLPNLPGAHQIDNAGAALAALRHLGATEDACRAAMENVFWPARMQRLRHGPLVDAALRGLMNDPTQAMLTRAPAAEIQEPEPADH